MLYAFDETVLMQLKIRVRGREEEKTAGVNFTLHRCYVGVRGSAKNTTTREHTLEYSRRGRST